MSLLSALKPGMTGVEQLQALLEVGEQPAIGQTLDFALTVAEKGFIVFEGRPSEKHFNPMGGVHGGYAAALLDSACGCVVHSMLDAGMGYTTVELKISYHRGITAQTGVVRAEGRVVSIGRRVGFAEAKLLDPNGKLLASATSSLLIFPL